MTPAPPRRLRSARLFLWLAIPLMAVAQCLPWEYIVFEHDYVFPLATTRFSQIPHVHRLYRSNNLAMDAEVADPPRFFEYDRAPRLRTSDLFAESPPEKVPVYHLRDLWAFGGAVIHQPRYLHSFEWTQLDLIVWLIVLPALVILPLAAGILSRGRPLLWLARFFAFSMLVWMIRNLILASGYPGAHLENVGSGYWLSTATFALVIAALFLIPHPGKNQYLRHPS